MTLDTQTQTPTPLWLAIAYIVAVVGIIIIAVALLILVCGVAGVALPAEFVGAWMVMAVCWLCVRWLIKNRHTLTLAKPKAKKKLQDA